MNNKPRHPLIAALLKLPIIVLIVAVAAYMIWAYVITEQNFKKQETTPFKFNTDGKVREIGYIYDISKETKITKQSTRITWFVKVPRTNELYSCSWEYGYAGYVKDEGVVLIHRSDDDVYNDDYNGYIVGLHGPSKGKLTWVWAVNNEALMEDLMQYGE